MKLIYEKTFRRALLSTFIVLFSLVSFSATYYVSNTGSDANSGLSSSLPWKTLSKVNTITFMAGDQILFQRGGTFYGTLTIKSSGTASAPIVYGAYGTGNNPDITGFTTVNGWVNLGGNIWESTTAVSTLANCNMVTIKDVNTAMGRTPNLGSYYTLQSHNANLSITSGNLTGTPNWTGAEVVIRKERWIWQKGKITSQSGSTISYTDEGKFTPRDNWGFFIQNDTRTLDSQNEWYYNSSTKKIRVYSTSQPVNVKVASAEYVINSSSKSYVTIDNLSVSGANTTGINFTSTSNLKIQNCIIKNCGLEGVRGTSYSNYYTLNNNIIKNCNYSGIFTYSSTNHHETITNNTVDSCAMVIGIGRLYAPAAIFSATENTLIQYNKVDHSGYNGLMVSSDRGEIRNNFVNNSLLNRSDGGGIYTAGGNVELIMDGNIVINSLGYTPATNNSNSMAVGIYLDLKTSYTTVSNNTVANCTEHGVFFNHHANYNLVLNNTVFNNTVSQLGMHDYTSTGMLKNNTVTGNLLIAKKATQLSCNFRSALNDIPSFMIVSNNNVFSRPIDNDNYIRAGQPNQYSGANDFKNFAQWQSFSGHDANSKTLTRTITNENDIHIEYNSTKTAKTIALSSPMIDVKGNKYSGSITLQPFTSAILMKDGTATTVVPTAPTLVVATAGNASATVTFAAPTNNGGSAITGYTVTSLPAGGTDLNAGSTSLTHTISGLTNGTTYTFTVKATNSAGSSVASSPSNAVVPKAPTAVASSFSFTGPSSGNVNSASSSFAVTPNNAYTGTITIAFTGTGNAGLSSKVLTFSNSSTSQTFTITPIVAGSITLTATNNGSLTNPASLTYMSHAVAPGAPTSVVATAGDANASIRFEAPAYSGGSTITGYTVTSIPAGGTDMNAGSTSLTHTISGLTNGTSYTFTVKATNSAGTSYASAASNSVVPGLAKDMVSPVITAFSIPSYISSLIVPIFTFTASDNIGVTGFLITESATAPAPGASSWSTWVPTVYVLSSPGSKTLYAWVKDAAGNISASRMDRVRVSKVDSRLKNGNYLKSTESINDLSEQNNIEIMQIDIFPNPSTSKVTVRFSVQPEDGSSIEILDISGRRITSRIISGTSEEFNLDQQPAGIYLIKSVLGSIETIQKLILKK